MSQALAIIPTSVKPKPSKREIVDALVELKKRQVAAESAKHGAAAEALRSRAKAAILSHLNLTDREGLEFNFGYTDGKQVRSVSVEIKVPLNMALTHLLLELHSESALSHQRVNEKELREELVAAADTSSQRVEALLSSPETKRALETLLVDLIGD
jgi:hypothetical protein